MRISSILLATVAAVAFSQSGQAFAQTGGGEDGPVSIESSAVDQVPGEIIVTAQRREQRLQDVPISASVVSGAALDRDGVRTLEELTSRLPNVRIAQVPGSDSINIRGVGSGNNLGFEQAVATFVDGIYRSRSRASRLAFFDVERVEVLRGPQTTFFGNNAIAGALNITTRRPGSSLEYNASALYAPSDGEYSAEAGVSLPIGDTLSVRLAGRQSGMSGYIRNARLGNEGPDFNDRIGRFSLRWQPGDTVTVDARMDVGRLRDTNIYNSELLNCPADAAFGAPRGACARAIAATLGPVDDTLDHHTFTGPGRLNFDYVESTFRASVDLAGHRLTAIAGYYDHDYDQRVNVVPTRDASVVGTVSGLPTRSREAYRQISQELRFESIGERSFDYMLGAYYAHSRLNAPTASGYYFTRFGGLAPAYFAATDPIAVFFTNREIVDVMSIFGSSTLDLSEALRLNLGLRYSIVDKHANRTATLGISDDSLDLATFIPGPAAGQTILLPILGADTGEFARTGRRDSKLMPAANLEYDVAEDVMAYASYSKGFKAGGFSIGLSKAVFDPETVDAYELGLKSSFLDKRLTLNIAAYLSKYRNLQESTFFILASGTPKGSIANVARSTAKGIELGGAFRATPALQLSFDLAYLSSKYDSYPLAPCTSLGNLAPNCTQDLSGTRRAFAPKFSGNIGLSYSAALSEALALRFDTNLFFSSRYFEQANGDPLAIQPGFAKIDARLGLGASDRRWEVAVIGRNLTDKATAGFRSPLPSSPGSYQAITDRPRSIAFQLSLRN